MVAKHLNFTFWQVADEFKHDEPNISFTPHMPPLPNHIITSIPAKCIIKFWERGKWGGGCSIWQVNKLWFIEGQMIKEQRIWCFDIECWAFLFLFFGKYDIVTIDKHALVDSYSSIILRPNIQIKIILWYPEFFPLAVTKIHSHLYMCVCARTPACH